MGYKGYKGCLGASSGGNGADKEDLVKLGRELHSWAVYETFARMLAVTCGFLEKQLMRAFAGNGS